MYKQSGTQNWQKLPENNRPFKLGESKSRDRGIGHGRQEQLPLSSSGSLLPYCFSACPSWNLNLPRTSPYETGDHAGSVTRTNFLVCSYWKFKPSWLGWNSRNKTKIVEHKLCNCVSFLDSHILTSKGNLLISEVEIHIRNYTILAAMLQKWSWSVHMENIYVAKSSCNLG